MATQKAVAANFRVCCNHGKTSKACTHTIEAITENFFNITKIKAVRPYGDAEDMCVIGTAMIRPSMRAKFERDLKGVKIRGGSGKITKAVVVLSGR
ncbi:MAG: hypothetical protein MPJ06_03830 [Nitrosopumilus sp.]|nr:hypothetical protein [Nitrosopumilus sp.]MDA7943119.1 hypothetical protein [Nitrosopumilus sp.]